MRSSREKLRKVGQLSEAEAILRNRTLRGEQYSQEQIQQAVEVLRQYDPDHPLLRYSERGQVSETS